MQASYNTWLVALSILVAMTVDAGMAEVATGVLHNVGNVLNSLGVSASMVQTQLRNSRIGNVRRIATLLARQGDDVGRFLSTDAGGKQIPGYLAQLGGALDTENKRLRTEAEAIVTHVGHIRAIVAAQQTYARRGGVTEAVDLAELVDNAVALHFATTTEVSIRREYDVMPAVMLDRHKLIQILGNLLSNARHALQDQDSTQRVLTLRLSGQDRESVVLEVEDSGAGIDAGAIERLFEFGFTTKKDGHGFGLHTSAILAKELGGYLTGHSDGPGRGARFVLRLPLVEAIVQRKHA